MLRDIAFSVAPRTLRVRGFLPDVTSIPTIIHTGIMPIRLRRISVNSPYQAVMYPAKELYAEVPDNSGAKIGS